MTAGPARPSTVSAGRKASSLDRARRQRELEELAAGHEVDLAVIGGGITGTFVALDAATRGCSVVLLERRDLAHGTSRWSSKLVHGGLRYLAHGELGLAHESAVERGILMERTAPHLTRALAMLAPVGGPMGWGQAALTSLGFVLADGLRVAAGTRRRTLPHPGWVGAQEARLLVPALHGTRVRGALRIWDGQLLDDARLVITVARTAAAFGARILTRCEVTAIDGHHVHVHDGLGGGELRIRARAVVNATGVWADRLHPEVRLRPSKGAHLLLRPEALGRPVAALTVPVPDDPGRYVFALPQPEGPVLLGLTDDPVDAVTDEPTVDDVEQAFLLDALSTALQVPLGPDDVVGSFAGLRPLLAGGEGPTADLSRAHAIIEGRDGLLTLVGGKLTTARRMAADVLDRLVDREGWAAGPCVTAEQPLVGALSRARLAALDAPRGLVARYGAEAVEVAARLAAHPELATRILDDRGERLIDLVWALEHEGAFTVDDLLDRRLRLGLVPEARQRARPAAEAALAAVPATPR